jgi:hypothetical protein
MQSGCHGQHGSFACADSFRGSSLPSGSSWRPRRWPWRSRRPRSAADGRSGCSRPTPRWTPFDDALARGRDATRARSTDLALLTEQAMLADRWRSSAARALLATREQRAQDVEERARLLDRFSARNAALAQRASSAQAARNRSRRLIVLFTAIAFVALLALAGAFTALRGWRRHAARVDEDKRLLLEDRRHRAAQEEFGRALQGTRTQREAQRMLKRYLERGLPSSLATVLDRDNADNRLEAVTALRPDSPLATTLEDAEPDDCLAVRFGRAHHRAAGGDPLLPCKLCGTLACAVTCVPSLVGGEVIGSVLVETPGSLDEDGRRRLEDAVAHAAPVLASMRNLRLAETRAATDALTGLANRRAAEETLRLMVASADRTTSCCAVACSTSTTSSTSTTRTATKPAITSSLRSAVSPGPRSAPATSSRASAARSSCWCSPTPTSRARWWSATSCDTR